MSNYGLLRLGTKITSTYRLEMLLICLPILAVFITFLLYVSGQLLFSVPQLPLFCLPLLRVSIHQRTYPWISLHTRHTQSKVPLQCSQLLLT